MVTLFEEKRKEISIHILAKVDHEGKLLIEGYDSGELVKKLRGSWEYEYYLTTSKNQKENLIKRIQDEGVEISTDDSLLNWIQAHFAGNEAFSTFQSFLASHGIKSEMYSW